MHVLAPQSSIADDITFTYRDQCIECVYLHEKAAESQVMHTETIVRLHMLYISINEK